MSIVIRRAWTRQPQYRAPLADLANVPGTIVHDEFGGINASRTRNGYLVRSTDSNGVVTSRSAAGYGDLVSSAVPVSTDTFTVFAYVKLVSSFGNLSPIDADFNGARCFQFRTNTGKFQIIAFDTSGSPYFAETTTSPSLTDAILLVGRFNGAAVDLFIPGEVASTTITGTPKPFVGNLVIGASAGGSNFPQFNEFPGLIYYAGVIPRALSTARIWQWMNNPWQLFAPRRILVPYASAGGAPTLSDLQAVSVTSSSVQATYDYAF